MTFCLIVFLIFAVHIFSYFKTEGNMQVIFVGFCRNLDRKVERISLQWASLAVSPF
jgi:hypothetical protein